MNNKGLFQSIEYKSMGTGSVTTLDLYQYDGWQRILDNLDDRLGTWSVAYGNIEHSMSNGATYVALSRRPTSYTFGPRDTRLSFTMMGDREDASNIIGVYLSYPVVHDMTRCVNLAMTERDDRVDTAIRWINWCMPEMDRTLVTLNRMDLLSTATTKWHSLRNDVNSNEGESLVKMSPYDDAIILHTRNIGTVRVMPTGFKSSLYGDDIILVTPQASNRMSFHNENGRRLGEYDMNGIHSSRRPGFIKDVFAEWINAETGHEFDGFITAMEFGD